MELKARECPHCHRQVSLQVCSKYLLRGTNYTVRCNHCNTELALVKEPLFGFAKVIERGNRNRSH